MNAKLYVINEDGDQMKEGFTTFADADAYRIEQSDADGNLDYFVILEVSEQEHVVREINLTELSIDQVREMLSEYNIA